MSKLQYESRTFHLALTPEYIKQGIPGSLASCPVALAAQDMIPGVIDVEVNGQELTFYDATGEWFIADLPTSANDFICWFDAFESGEQAWRWLMERNATTPGLLAFDVEPRWFDPSSGPDL